MTFSQFGPGVNWIVCRLFTNLGKNGYFISISYLQTLTTVRIILVIPLVVRAWTVWTTIRAFAFLGLLENDVNLVRFSNDWNILFGMKLIFFLDHVAVALLFCLLMSLQLSPTQVCNLMIRLFLHVKSSITQSYYENSNITEYLK